MSFELLLEFDTDDYEFMRGFESGRIWWEVSTSEDEVTEVAHAANAEMLLRIGEATGRSVQTMDLDETYVEVTFGPPAE